MDELTVEKEDVIDGQLERVNLLVEVARYREALEVLRALRAKMPENYSAICLSAVCHMGLKEYQRGYDLTKQAIAGAPDHEWAYRIQSHIFSANGEAGRALESARRCAQLSPFDPLALECLFWAQTAFGSLDDAEITLRSVLSMVPESADAYRAAAYLALQKEDFVQAKDMYLKALDLDPESATALNNLGVVYKRMAEKGRGARYHKLSAEMFERSAKADPTFKTAQHNLSAASTAKKAATSIGFVLGYFFLVQVLIRAVAYAMGNHNVFEDLEVLYPISSNPIVTVVNFLLLFVLLASAGAAVAALSPRFRDIVAYEMGFVRWWAIAAGIFISLFAAEITVIAMFENDVGVTNFFSLLALLILASVSIILAIRTFFARR